MDEFDELFVTAQSFEVHVNGFLGLNSYKHLFFNVLGLQVFNLLLSPTLLVNILDALLA